MKVIGVAPQHYAFIQSQRQTEQAEIRHRENLKNLEKMNQETIQAAETHRATLQMHNAKFDRQRQMMEAYVGAECQKEGHSQAMSHVDVKV